MTTDTITRIPLADLNESPFNPRKVFEKTALDELAVDIQSVGRVLQPLLVRPIVPPLFKGDEHDQAGFEIVFGHRRARAAAQAGLDAVDCMVRPMSDDEARRAQISENLQRKDVHPIEEAEGFQALIDNDNMTADLIAERFGKSRSYVYGRLKLLQACSAIRHACLMGEIDAEVALLIARLQSTKHQEKALGYIRADYHDLTDGGAKSYRQIRALLAEKFTLDLAGAMFDIEDEMLLPLAGNCVRCAKRTGNAPEYSDLVDAPPARHRGASGKGNADACTDPDCFDEKKKAHLKREAAKLEAEGATVVQGGAARAAISATGEMKNGYLPLADVQKALKKAGKKADALKMQTVLIQDPRSGKTHKAVKVGALVEAGIREPEPPESKANARREADYAKAREEALRRDEESKREQALNDALLDRIIPAMAATPRTATELAWVVENVFDSIEWQVKQRIAKRRGFSDPQELASTMEGMEPGELAVLAVELILTEDGWRDQWRTYGPASHARLHASAAHYGIDVDQVRAEIAPASEATSTPASAARAPKSAKPKAEKSKPRKQKDDAGSAGGEAGADLFSQEAAEA